MGSIRAAFPLAALVAVIVILPDRVLAQTKLLTIDDLYDPVKKVDFGKTRSPRESPVRVAERRRVRAQGRRRPLLPRRGDVRNGNAGLRPRAARTGAVARARRHAEGSRKAARRDVFAGLHARSSASTRTTSSTGRSVRPSVRRLTATPSKEEDAQFSPDGRLVAFVRDNNLFVVDLDGKERALTSDGTRGRHERQVRLGVSGGDLRARHLSGILVEPRFLASRVHPAIRRERPDLPCRRSDPAAAGGRADAISAARRSESYGQARRGARIRRRAVDRHREVQRCRPPDRQCVVGTRQRARLVSGPESRADLARSEPRRRDDGPQQNAVSRNEQSLGRRQRRADLAEGRRLRVAERTLWLRARLSIRASTARCPVP